MRISFLCTVLFLLDCGVASAQTLQDVTNNGNATTVPIYSNGVGARYILHGDQGRYVQWRASNQNQVAWIGYGTTGSNTFGFYNVLGGMFMQSSLLDIKNRTMVNNGVDDSTSALIVNGNVRLGNRGQSYIVKYFATFGETISGAATVIANDAIVNKDVTDRVDHANTNTTGNNAMVMSYYYGTMFHVKSSGASHNAGDKWFGVGDGTDEVMRLTPGKNVLIGTIVDDASYKLQVKGGVKAQKVKVTQTGWADFVFEPSYKLPSLYEVEQFILQHKHLPEIPSAKEVAEDGIDLGEMNRKLLQKIEEQTLYIIEMNKRLRVLEEKVMPNVAESGRNK